RFWSCDTNAAAPTPAKAAIKSASSDGQTQSPGYHPTRLRQARLRLGISPLASTGSRRPHSRQYSWFGACGVPQRGHSGPAGPRASSRAVGASPFRGGGRLSAYSSQRSGFGLSSSMGPTLADSITPAPASRSPSPFGAGSGSGSAAFPQLGQ